MKRKLRKTSSNDVVPENKDSVNDIETGGYVCSVQ